VSLLQKNPGRVHTLGGYGVVVVVAVVVVAVVVVAVVVVVVVVGHT
jgi:hypothetical protein